MAPDITPERREIEILKAKIANLEADSVVAQNMRVLGTLQAKEGLAGFFDKHGAVTILVAIFLQTCGAIWWAATISDQVGVLSEKGRQRDLEIQKLTDIVQQNADRLTRVQTVQENVVKILDRLAIAHNPGG